MNRPQLEQLIRDSLTQSPETHVHMLAARIRELEARAVVVPDITDDDIESVSTLMQENGIGCHSADNDDFRRIVAATWAYAQGASAIPADRVLVNGEIKGTPEELAKIAEEAGWEWIRAPIESKKALVDWMADALRANQGGANT